MEQGHLKRVVMDGVPAGFDASIRPSRTGRRAWMEGVSAGMGSVLNQVFC